jgi:hypothetical protein
MIKIVLRNNFVKFTPNFRTWKRNWQVRNKVGNHVLKSDLKSTIKSKTASDIELLEVKTLIDNSLFWGLGTFYFLALNYFSTSVFQEK